MHAWKSFVDSLEFFVEIVLSFEEVIPVLWSIILCKAVNFLVM